MNRDELAFVAAVCQSYGKRVDGGYEIFISNEALGNLPQHGIVQQLPLDLREPGVRIQYLTSQTIDGGVAQLTPVESETSHEEYIKQLQEDATAPTIVDGPS